MSETLGGLSGEQTDLRRPSGILGLKTRTHGSPGNAERPLLTDGQ